MADSINKNILYLIIILYFPCSSYAWEEVNCKSINEEFDIIHSYYSFQQCYTNHDNEVKRFSADFDKDREYLWLDFYELTNGQTWRSNSASNAINAEYIKHFLSQFGFGNILKVDKEYSSIKSSNNNIRYYYRNFETSDGKGVYGAGNQGNFFYQFGILTEHKDTIFDENFLSEILSSLKMNRFNKGKNSSVRPSITTRKKERS